MSKAPISESSSDSEEEIELEDNNDNFNEKLYSIVEGFCEEFKNLTENSPNFFFIGENLCFHDIANFLLG